MKPDPQPIRALRAVLDGLPFDWRTGGKHFVVLAPSGRSVGVLPKGGVTENPASRRRMLKIKHALRREIGAPHDQSI